MQTRIYLVNDGESTRLVEGANPAQVIRYCAMGKYRATPAKPRDVATLMAHGVKVEVIAQDAQESLPLDEPEPRP